MLFNLVTEILEGPLSAVSKPVTPAVSKPECGSFRIIGVIEIREHPFLIGDLTIHLPGGLGVFTGKGCTSYTSISDRFW